ncbi:LRR receptor-like serine/threonine-protein kinase FLS2 [Lathyrus oleraceus]|uniref:LRR receptor-like serine/threonine-protein kinase FLS2 n=1 Tax=Pisum sativum TaxID=3888 RepID=UPI0021CE7E98|nr:LRR receptor-like serine/threonine-protein kinase FLS2 [Pisum sativum]
MKSSKAVSTPLATHFKLGSNQSTSSEEEAFDMKCVPYVFVVDSLMYVMMYTIPDISHDAGTVSMFLSNPGREHWNAVKWIYDMARDIDYIKSTSSYMIKFAGEVVAWQSKLQKFVALSTTETKFIAINEEYKYQSATHLGKNLTFHNRFKHIDVRYHWLHDILDAKLLELAKVHTDDNGSDMMTKALPRRKFQACCDIAGLHLDVSNNLLYSIPDGFISACGKIESLKLLNFSRNVLNGVLPALHGFGGLESLDMSFNNLKGSIGLQLDGMVSLKSLDLSNNTFIGKIPIKLGRSMILEQLVLSNNRFQGTIPEQILSYKNLTVIDFKENDLSEFIPSNIDILSKLEFLSLSSNKLVGKIPMTIMNITSFGRFAANQNQFTDPVPFGITKYLNSLDLSYNHLSESILEGLLSPPQLVLVDLSYNRLKGPVPLTGLIPPESGSFKKLALLNLAENQLTGALPPELGNLISLQVLKLQMDKLNGIIPIQISQLQKLSTLNLSQNSLDGPIPSEMTTNLTLLYLQGNKLNGSIPPSIGNLRQVLELQLGEKQLSGDIPKMPWSLQIALNLSSNHFSGNIPSSFGDLVNLEVLDLSNNNFSGEIHVSLTKMAALTQLQLSNNRLSGDLPSFGSYVNVDTRGTDVKKNSDIPVNNFPSAEKSGKSVVVAVLIAIAAAIFVVGVVTLLVVLLSRHYFRGNNERVQASEGENFDLKIIQSNLLTSNGIRRSNIDFSKTMEAAATQTHRDQFTSKTYPISS